MLLIADLRLDHPSFLSRNWQFEFESGCYVRALAFVVACGFEYRYLYGSGCIHHVNFMNIYEVDQKTLHKFEDYEAMVQTYRKSIQIYIASAEGLQR